MARTEPNPVRECYFAAEIESMLGLARGALYRKGALEELTARGFPESLTLGRYRFPKAKVDAWIRGNKPPAPAANDVAPPLTPNGAEEWRNLLHRAYSQSR